MLNERNRDGEDKAEKSKWKQNNYTHLLAFFPPVEEEGVSTHFPTPACFFFLVDKYSSTK